MNHDSDYIVGSGLLAAASWATAVQPLFSIMASIAAIVLSIMGIINIVRKWRNEKK